MPQLHKARLAAQKKHLDEKLCQRIQVTGAELTDRVVVRMLPGGDETECHVAVGLLFDLAR
ncbi:hypothetical protein ES703_116532 [subsurface metagenome]